MMMNNYVDQSEPFSRRLRRNGGKLPAAPVPSAVVVVNDNISALTSLNGGSANSSRPASGGRQSDRSVKMDYSTFGQVAQQPASARFEMDYASVNQTMATGFGGLRSAVVTSGYSAPKRSPSIAGHFSGKFDNVASRTNTTSSSRSGIAPFPKSQASQSGVRKHSSDKFKADPISEVAKNFFRTNRRLKDFLSSHGALSLLPEGMVIVDKNHVSEELKNSIFEMNSPSDTPPAQSTALIPVPSTFSDFNTDIAEETEMLRLAMRTDHLTLDSDFAYRGHNELGQVESPSPVCKPSLLEMDDNILSAYGYSFGKAIDQGGFASQLYQGQGLNHNQSFAAFGQAQLEGGFAQGQEYTTNHAQGHAFNVQAPEFTPRLQHAQLANVRGGSRRTNKLGNGVYFNPPQLLRSSTDPDKEWA